MAKEPNITEFLNETEPNLSDFLKDDEINFYAGQPSTATLDPNEISKRSKDVLDMATNLEIPISQAEKNLEQVKPLDIFSRIASSTFPSTEDQFETHLLKKPMLAARQSIDSVNASQAITDAYFSGKDLIPLLQEKSRMEALAPVTGDNFASDTFYKGIAVAAPMFESLYEASPFAAITTIGGAIIGGVAGNLLPGGVGAPEELITVPAGAKVGMAAGTMFGMKAGITAKSAEYWYRQGVGEMIYSMNKNGVDMKYAGPIAAVAGIPYASIEYAQISQLTPGLRTGVQNIGVNSMLKAFTAAAKKYGTTYVTENVEEVLQEGIQIAAEDIGNLFEGNDLKFDKEGFIERANRLANTSVEAGQSMLLLPLGGAAVDVSTGVMQVKNKNKFVDAVRKQVGVPKDAAVLAADMLREGKSVKEVDQMLSQVKAGIEAKKTVETKTEAVEATQGEPTEKGRPTIIVPNKGLLVYEETEEGLKLQNIDVVEAERRQGIGTKMVEKAEEITGKKFTETSEVASPEGKAFIEKTIKPPEAPVTPEVPVKGKPAKEAQIAQPAEQGVQEKEATATSGIRTPEGSEITSISDRSRTGTGSPEAIASSQTNKAAKLSQEYLPENWKIFYRGKTYKDAYGMEKPVKAGKQWGILTDKGIDTRSYGATPEKALNKYLADKNKPLIDTRTEWLKRVETEEGSPADIQAVASDILIEQFGQPQHSAKSEAEYFELDDGRRIRLAQHDVVYKESDVDLVINIGRSQDADAIIPTDVTSEKQIRDIIQKAIKTQLTPTPQPVAPTEKPTAKAQKVEAPEEIKTVEEKKAEERDILGGVDPINQIQIALKQAKEVQPRTEAEKKAELKRRTGKARGIAKSLIAKGVPVEEALRRSTSALKGPLTEYDQVYESIADILEPGAKNEAELMIWRHPELRYFEKLNTDASFNKLINGSALTPGDVQNIERVFGKTFEEFTKPRETISDLYDRAIALWKAGLLTGIKTTGLNTLANVSHSMTETAKDIPAAGIDRVVKLFTGKRALAFTTKGSLKGAKEGLKRGWNYLKTGIDERNIGAKLDYNRVNFGTSKIARGLQAYEETIFHLLGAEDQPFYYGNKARSLKSQSIAQAKNKGLKGKEANAFVDNLVQNPTDEMLEWATHDAEVAVFQNRTKAGDIARSIQKVKGGEIVVPFGRTPAAVATQIINYSPVGVVKEIAQQIHNKEFDQRKFSQASGRSILGTGALYLGTQLFKAGLIALDYPDNEKERKLWEAEGRKPNSIKVGDKWRDVQVLGPVGNLLVIGGHFQNALESSGSQTEAIVEAMAGGAKSFTEQTFVRGVNLAVDAMTDPERSFDRWFTSMAGSAVPTIVADIARAQDEINRRSVGPFQRVQSRIPFYRQGLEPKIDVFGQDMPRYGGNVLESMIDPTRPSKIRQDVVVDELRRLWDKDIKVSPTQLGDKKGYDILTPEENTQLWRRAGELTYKTLFAIINGENYEKAHDFAKGKIINIGVNQAKAAAKAEIANIKLNEGKTVLELAESGLLTIDEFEMLKYFQEQE